MSIGPVNPNDRKQYEAEYKQGADLFQRALADYAKSDNPFQKAEFIDVMDKSLKVLNETAQALSRKELQKQNEQIAKDFAVFQKESGDQDRINQLNTDLDKAKKSV
jgi:23S rRNA pseudoU1915 N3-methylase RlmH